MALPAGNYFGISAATPENPDTFEIFKFVLTSVESGAARPPPVPPQQQGSQQPIFNRGAGDQDIEDHPASYYTTSEQQFADLHNRLQLINHATTNLIREVTALSSKTDRNHKELLQNLVTRDMLANLDARLLRIEQGLQAIKRDLEGKDYQDRFAQLQETLRHSHVSLAENLQGAVTNSKSTDHNLRASFFSFHFISLLSHIPFHYIFWLP